MPTYYFNPQKKTSFWNGLSINSSLIFLNVLFFIIFTILLYFKIIPIDFIAIKPENILQGKYFWTFISSMFMHAGFFHIFANMLSLFFVGRLIESLLGRKRYLWFYLISGLFSGVFFVGISYIFSLIENISIGQSIISFGNDLGLYAVGASGAIFGLIGLLMFLTPNLPVYLMFIPIPVKMKYAAPGMLILLWFISIAGNVPIGNTAHFGGLLAGIAYGIYLIVKFPNKTNYIRNYFK